MDFLSLYTVYIFLLKLSTVDCSIADKVSKTGKYAAKSDNGKNAPNESAGKDWVLDYHGKDPENADGLKDQATTTSEKSKEKPHNNKQKELDHNHEEHKEYVDISQLVKGKGSSDGSESDTGNRNNVVIVQKEGRKEDGVDIILQDSEDLLVNDSNHKQKPVQSHKTKEEITGTSSEDKKETRKTKPHGDQHNDIKSTTNTERLDKSTKKYNSKNSEELLNSSYKYKVSKVSSKPGSKKKKTEVKDESSEPELNGNKKSSGSGTGFGKKRHEGKEQSSSEAETKDAEDVTTNSEGKVKDGTKTNPDPNTKQVSTDSIKPSAKDSKAHVESFKGMIYKKMSAPTHPLPSTPSPPTSTISPEILATTKGLADPDPLEYTTQSPLATKKHNDKLLPANEKSTEKPILKQSSIKEPAPDPSQHEENYLEVKSSVKLKAPKKGSRVKYIMVSEYSLTGEGDESPGAAGGGHAIGKKG